jgi:hypothetical protein
VTCAAFGSCAWTQDKAILSSNYVCASQTVLQHPPTPFEQFTSPVKVFTLVNALAVHY